MQSFAGKVKNELCRVPVQRLCCARAEAYGVLLYGNTFSPTEVRLITESADFAARLPRLFQRAFSLKFDSLPDGTRDKLIFRITQRHKLARIVDLLGYDPSLVLHVNFGLLEGPFWPGAASRTRKSAITWSWPPPTPRPAGRFRPC